MGDAKLVSLYRCKQCSVRMYEHDTAGHLLRHGLTGINGDWREYFTKTKPDTFDKPGGAYKPYYQKSTRVN